MPRKVKKPSSKQVTVEELNRNITYLKGVTTKLQKEIHQFLHQESARGKALEFALQALATEKNDLQRRLQAKEETAIQELKARIDQIGVVESGQHNAQKIGALRGRIKAQDDEIEDLRTRWNGLNESAGKISQRLVASEVRVASLSGEVEALKKMVDWEEALLNEARSLPTLDNVLRRILEPRRQ
jgi:chromosome segregation ATPase